MRPRSLAVLLFLVASVPLAGQLPQCGRDYEPVLFPIILPEPTFGAFGSVFRTELVGFNGGGTEADIWRGCDVRNPFDGTGGYSVPPNSSFVPVYWGDAERGNPGVMLHVLRAGSPVQFSLRLISQNSASAHGYVLELPVVRESEFRTHQVQLFPVTLASGTRSQLRVYDPQVNSTYVTVRVFGFENQQELAYATLPLGGVSSAATHDSAGYASLSVDNLVAIRDLPLRIEVESQYSDGKVWAFVSTTDNATQGISVVTPR